MRCGDSARNVQTFIPLNGPQMQVVAGCQPDAGTQALLVTRSGAGDVNAAGLRDYVNAGGIVITEFGVSDEVFNMVFGTAVAQGARNGACSDSIVPPVQLSPDHVFWRENRHAPPQSTGCGHDLTAFPGITRLGGWTADTTSLAFRDRGAGRVWLVETDWQDSGNGFDAAARGLMQWMILNSGRGAQGRPFNLVGPQVGVSEEDLVAGGLVPCFSDLYGDTEPFAPLLARCDDEVLMLACRPAGETTLSLAAMGERAQVLLDVGNENEAAHQHNGSTWYYGADHSLGFAGARDVVNRSSCDTAGAGEDDRLCWHLGQGNIEGGFRCGSDRFLNASEEWERIVYQRGGALTE